MTDAVAISIVTSIAAVLMAGISAFFSYRAKAVAEETHKAVNSRLTSFLELAKKSFTNDGVLQEKEAQLVRDETAKDKGP